MHAGVHITSAACGGAYAEEQEARDAHAQQDGEEELGPAGRVHRGARSSRRLLGAGGVPPRLTALSAQRRPDVGRTVLESYRAFRCDVSRPRSRFAFCDAFFFGVLVCVATLGSVDALDCALCTEPAACARCSETPLYMALRRSDRASLRGAGLRDHHGVSRRPTVEHQLAALETHCAHQVHVLRVKLPSLMRMMLPTISICNMSEKHSGLQGVSGTKIQCTSDALKATVQRSRGRLSSCPSTALWSVHFLQLERY